MDRLTLPRVYPSIDVRQCLPAGDNLPSWSSLPLDTKLPMYRTPRGRLTLHTTPVSDPKYRNEQCIDFDLSDPNGMSSPTEYHPLHDPHLKSHFDIPAMRRHLVRNGFITKSGKVICTLKEFNKYRSYLRRLCLLDVIQDRKEELAQLEVSRRLRQQMRMEAEVPPSQRFLKVKEKQKEISEKWKKRSEEITNKEIEKMAKLIVEQSEKQLALEDRKRYSENRRLHILLNHKIEVEKKNQELIRKCLIKDREIDQRLIEEKKRQKILLQTRQNLMSWGNRKENELDKLENERIVRERVRQRTERRILHREKTANKLFHRQMVKQNQIKQKRVKNHIDHEMACAQRLARKIVTGQMQRWSPDKGRCRQSRNSPYNSVWQFDEVVRLLDLANGPDDSQPRTSSLDFLRMCDYSVENSEFTKMLSSDEDNLNQFAADIVQSVVTKVKYDMFPGYNTANRYYEGELGDLDGDGMGENEVELTFSRSSEGRRRSVRFNNDDNIIPNSAGGNSSGLLAPGTHGSLKPVSEHVLTPVPSPLPPEFFRRDSEITESVRQDVSAVETLLLRLLDDLNHARLSREDLEIIATHCFGILKDHDEEDSGELEGFEIQKDLKKTSSCRVANELIQFTLHKLLKDIKSGTVQNGDLTAITKCLVSSRQHRSTNPLDDDIYGNVMDTLERVGVELGGKEGNINDNLGLDDFISDTLCQVVDDIKNKTLSEADLIKIGSNVVAASADESAGIRESDIRPSLEKIIQDLNDKKLKVDGTLSAIISSYYIVNKFNREAIKNFAKEILPKLVLGLNQVNDANLTINLTTLAGDVEADRLAESEVQEVGKVLLDAGKKYLAQRQASNKTKSSSSKDTPIGVKELTFAIRKDVNKNDFRKVVFKALADYFVRRERLRSNSKSGYSSIHTPASSQSKLAVNIVLATMDRITRDVYSNQIPAVILTSIATSLFHLANKHPTIYNQNQQFGETKPMDVLEHILHQSKRNKITYRDTKRIFASIFHSYVDPTVDDKVPEFQEIDHKNTLIIGELIDETINHIVHTVASEIKEKLPGEQIAIIEIEDMVREELHGLGESSGRSPEIKHIEGDLDQHLMGCLSKAAREIANCVEGVDSEASLASGTKMDEACFSSRVVDFMLSVIDHLIKNFKNGDITSASVREFLTYVLKTSHVGVTDDHLNERLNLLKTDIEQRREDSSFFSPVAVLFSQLTLNPRSTSPGLCILSKIMSSIDANVLLEFVQAAMLSVLTYINEAPREQLELPIDDENSLFRVESFILVRRVISYVINKITDDVKSQAMKTSGSKSLIKKLSFKKLDKSPEDDRKLRECVLDTLNETVINLKSELAVDHRKTDPDKFNPMTSIDNNILVQMEKITQMIKCRAAGGPCATPTKDDLLAIADVMKEVTEDMTEALAKVSDLNLATNISMADLTSDNVEQLVLQSIHDALTSMQAEGVEHLDKTTSLSIVSSKSSHLVVVMFTEVLSRTVDNVRKNRISRENLLALAEDLAERVGPCPKSSFDSMNEAMLNDFIVECLSEFKERVEAGKLDKNVMEEVTRRMALMNIDKLNSSSSLCAASSMTVDIMVKNVLSSIITETGKAQALTQVEHMTIPSDKSLTEAESLNEVILKPIVGTKPLDVSEDLISPALSAITMKTRASHHNPPETEPRQSYRSLICPDIRDKTAKGAITAIVGSDKMGSGAVVTLNELEELSGEETGPSDTESQTFVVTELTGSQASAGPKSRTSAAGKSSKTRKSTEAVTKTSSSPAKPKSSTTDKTSTTVKSVGSMSKSMSKTSSSSVSSKHTKSETSHKESMEELVHVHDVLPDSKSTESQSQVGAVKSVCGSHRSAVVVREQDEEVDSR